MHGYKALHKDFTGLNGFQYEIGKSYELNDKLKICHKGFHFCKDLLDVYAYYPFKRDIKVVEIEAYGDIQQAGTQYATNKIKIIKEIRFPYFKMLKTFFIYRKKNIGIRNYGSSNLGSYNQGCGNIGFRNHGNYNNGWYNAGDNNIGDNNAGNGNIGSYNNGNNNSGWDNIGDFNFGTNNNGQNNFGHLNCGDNNVGICNSGQYCYGLFNTMPQKPMIFNQEVNMSMEEFHSLLKDNLDIFERVHDKCCSKEDIDFIKQLPNFDENIFKEIVGISIDDLI